MKFFLHTPEQVRLINGDAEASFTPNEFCVIEPDYPGLPAGMIARYWTPERHFVGDGNGIYPDTVDCAPYVEKVNVYLHNLPSIYAHVTLSRTALSISSLESIQFAAALKPTADPASEPLPIDREWLIRLRHENGLLFDAFRVVFVGGACAYTYTPQSGLPLGVWYVDEQDFDKVVVAGQTYQVTLVAPVRFTVYREL